MYDFVDKRLENLSKHQGEVLDLGVTHYFIAKPVVKPSLNEKSYFGLNSKDFSKSSAALVDWRKKVIDRGTVAELKERAKKIVFSEGDKDVRYYIVSRNTDKVYCVKLEGKEVKSTKKKSDSKTLTYVFEYHDYLIYGWASC